jgi:tRNA threonylcarbamoyladenosine biosynthesis protein TsaB
MSVVILAIDTSHLPGSIAVAQGSPKALEVKLSEQLPQPGSTARAFAVRIRDMLRSIDSRPADVGLVAVDVGPGSFTGLRIAVTFAKTFAYATGADVVGVSSMDVLAHQAAVSRAEPIGRLWTLVDAHRGQVFAALYESSGLAARMRLQPAQEPQLIQIDRWCNEVAPTDVLTGPVVQRLLPLLPQGIETIESQARIPAALAVAQVAWRDWQEGRRDDLWQLRPFYIRQSAAEERRNAAST